MPASLIVFGFAPREGDVTVFDHVLDLSPHYLPSAQSSMYGFTMGLLLQYEAYHTA